MQLKQQDEAEQEKVRKKDDEPKKEEEERAKYREQQAMLNVLKVLQRFTSANPENFGQLKVELEETMSRELPNAGKQEEILKSEAQRVLTYTTQYMKRLR